MAFLRSRGRVFALLLLASGCITLALIYHRGDHYGVAQKLPKINIGIPDIVSETLKDVFPPDFGTAMPDISPASLEDAINDAHGEPHPIEDLLRTADARFEERLAKETFGVQEAADAYRKRRGRHPPPRFGAWVKFAEENGAVIVEDFFDQIYEDLNPFWAMNPHTMRQAARAWPHYISVRGGNVTTHLVDAENVRMSAWADMISKIAPLLPDVDLAMNVIDEPRMLVAWESIQYYMALAVDNHAKVSLDMQQSLQIHDYPTRPPPRPIPEAFDPRITNTAPVWAMAREACSPNTPARGRLYSEHILEPPTFPTGFPNESYHGYISNWTYATDPCQQTHLRHLHGALIEPTSTSIPQSLFPLFGESKFSMNNDILLPSHKHWTEPGFASGGEVHVPWSAKKNQLIWRHEASGGRNRLRTWARFHRHRFVSMMNATHVHAAQTRQAHSNRPRAYPPLADNIHMYTWPLPDPTEYPLAALADRHMAAWVASFASDVAFTSLDCFPEEGKNNRGCSYTNPFFAIKPPLSIGAEYNYKYIPDLDANSHSPRFRALLRSNSVPLKASLFAEWYDARLLPWKHFVPLDTTYRDLWGVMQYFLGYDPQTFRNETLEPGFVTPPADVGAAGRAPEEDHVHSHAAAHRGGHIRGQPPVADVQGVAFAPESEVEVGSDVEADAPSVETRDSRRRDTVGTPETEAKVNGQAGNTASQRSKQDTQPSPMSSLSPSLHFVPGHDAVARYIAESGHVWARRVLRREDMLVYVYRLVLEYARVVDEGRERMAWMGEG